MPFSIAFHVTICYAIIFRCFSLRLPLRCHCFSPLLFTYRHTAAMPRAIRHRTGRCCSHNNVHHIYQLSLIISLSLPLLFFSCFFFFMLLLMLIDDFLRLAAMPRFRFSLMRLLFFQLLFITFLQFDFFMPPLSLSLSLAAFRCVADAFRFRFLATPLCHMPPHAAITLSMMLMLSLPPPYHRCFFIDASHAAIAFFMILPLRLSPLSSFFRH